MKIKLNKEEYKTVMEALGFASGCVSGAYTAKASCVRMKQLRAKIKKKHDAKGQE